MNIDTPIALTNANTRRRRMLGLTVMSAAALTGVVLAGHNAAVARADEDQALIGSWMVAATATGAQPGPPRILVSFTGDGVAVRAGHHCTQPLMDRLGVPATTRASFYIYNQADEVDQLVSGIQKAQKVFA